MDADVKKYVLVILESGCIDYLMPAGFLCVMTINIPRTFLSYFFVTDSSSAFINGRLYRNVTTWNNIRGERDSLTFITDNLIARKIIWNETGYNYP